MEINKLHFFDSKGYNLNFDWNETYGYWHGAIYLPKVSVGLYANTSIYVLEEIGDSFYFPTAKNSGDEIVFTWDRINTFVDEFFMFNFDKSYTLSETSSLTYTPNDGPECNTLIVNRFDRYEVPLESEHISKALPIHVAFMANEKYDATTYNRTLVMSYNDTIIAKITFFAETVEEDERLKIWNENLGYNITPEDEMIFYKSDINEYRPNYMLLNEKRKELMMEGSNIYPYIGSYKAIINALKFFGYENLNIIEYWKNVNPNDINFGKIYHSSKYSLNHKETLRIGTRNIVLPNKDYKKNNSLALVYSINQPTSEKDELELPLVEEKFTYTIEEALIKLFALRKKLNKDFMPGTSRIIDIIGEANYFTIKGLMKISDASAIDISEKRYNVDFIADHDRYIHITDNNELNNYISHPGESDSDPVDSPLDGLSNIDKCKWFRDYYNDTFVDYNIDPYIYVDQVYNYNKVQDRYTAKVILKVNPDDITFGDCDLKFGCKVNKFKSDNSIDFDNPETLNVTFENINTYHYPQTISWVIKMSNNQIDDDLKNIGIQKSYRKNTFEYKVINKPLSEYNQLFVELPYLGYYDVTMYLGEYNEGGSESEEENVKSVSKFKYIKVEPYQLSLIGFYYDARDLPNHLKYDMDDDMAEFIQDSIDRMYYLALDERKNKTDLDVDFTIPYKEEGTDTYVVKGPYFTNTMDNEWYLSDNLTYEITKLVPITKYTRYIKNGVDVKPYTWFLLGYDYSKIVGAKNPKWTITNNSTNTKKTYDGNYLTLLLRKVGNYTINLKLTDENNNIYEITRNIIVVNKSANYNIYQSFKKDYDFITSQELDS